MRGTGLTAGPSLACRAAASGEAYTIPFTGESDFVYVDDVAAAFEAAASPGFDGAQVHNVTGELAAAADVAAILNRLVPGARIDAAGPALPVAARIDEGELRQVFPSVPRTALADGIAHTLHYYSERR